MELIDSFEKLLAEGHTRLSASKVLSISIADLRRTYKQFCRDWPADNDRNNALRDNLEKELKNGLTQKQIGDKYGMSQANVSALIYKLNLTGLAHNRSRGGFDKEEVALIVIEDIKARGGSINDAINRLQLNITAQTVRHYARKIGFNYKDYVHAYKQYGNWTTLPSDEVKVFNSDFIVQAVCGCCGKQQSVYLVNLRSGRSRACMNCATKKRVPTPIICKQTGKVFSSIREFSRFLNRPHSYQSVRIGLLKHGIYHHEGRDYIPLSSFPGQEFTVAS